MNYIIFDLELNQPYNNIKAASKCPFEIIQIGAFKLDSHFNTISTFDAYVKPSIYEELHPFVQNLTGITPDQLKAAATFKEVFQNFTGFIESKEAVFCVWGLSDMTELFRNTNYYQLEENTLPQKYINLQTYTSKHFGTPKKSRISLQNAAGLLGISFDRPFHNAFSDAFYTAEIFKKLYDPLIEPETYKHNQIRSYKSRFRPPKKVIDFDSLVKQFEKMVGRQMTGEEISIITLAYKMGMTHQFLRDAKEL